MKIIIVGGGKTLYFLCRSFVSKGYQVVIINRNQEESIQISRELKATVIKGDASDFKTLEEAQARTADTILAITPNDQDNLIICQMAQMRFGVTKAIALANDPDNKEIFEELGVSAFSTTEIIGNLIEQKASLEQVLNMLPIGEGKVNITEIAVNNKSIVLGKKLKDIVLPSGTLVAVIIRDEKPIIPNGNDDILENDKVLVITQPINHDEVIRLFSDL